MQKLLTSLAGTTVAAVLLAGCAQVPPNAGENPSDPYERVNRNIYAFNDSIDRALFRPVAETYVEWTPEWVRTRVSNVVDNLGDPGNAVNNTLQGKVDRGIESLMRFLVNSTFGIAGIFDVADEIGLKRHSEDFGQTLGVWGVGSGSYLVLPILPHLLRKAENIRTNAPKAASYDVLSDRSFSDIPTTVLHFHTFLFSEFLYTA